MNDRQKAWIVHKGKQKSFVKDNGCIEYTGLKNNGGYGIIEYTDEITGKRICLPMHRALFIINIGMDLESWQFVLHSCDNPACINIKHLRLGTAKDNSADKVNRERYAKKITYHHRSKKYSEEHINNVKQALSDGISLKDVCIKFDMKYGYVRDINAGIVKKDSWRQYPLLITKSFKTWNIAYKQGRIKI